MQLVQGKMIGSTEKREPSALAGNPSGKKDEERSLAAKPPLHGILETLEPPGGLLPRPIPCARWGRLGKPEF